MKILLIVLLILAPTIVRATDEGTPQDVEVVAGDNAVSARFAYSLKEKIRSSHSFRLVSSNVERIRICVTAVPVSDTINASAVSVTWTYVSPLQTFQVYLYTAISVVPNPRMNEGIEMIMSNTDRSVEIFNRLLLKP